MALVCGLTEALAELIQQPQLHADEGLPAFLGQLAPGFGSRQHVTDAALREPQHLRHAASIIYHVNIFGLFSSQPAKKER